MRRLAVIALVWVTAIFVVLGVQSAFAGDAPSGPPKPRVDATLARIDNDVTLPLPDGGQVACVVLYDRPGARAHATGITCDWEHRS